LRTCYNANYAFFTEIGLCKSLCHSSQAQMLTSGGRTAPCGHTCCDECVAQLNPRLCPTCRAPLPLKLTRSFALVEIFECVQKNFPMFARELTGAPRVQALAKRPQPMLGLQETSVILGEALESRRPRQNPNISNDRSGQATARPIMATTDAGLDNLEPYTQPGHPVVIDLTSEDSDEHYDDVIIVDD
jgi:hypothetical protein